jgi:hypothetical protein
MVTRVGVVEGIGMGAGGIGVQQRALDLVLLLVTCRRGIVVLLGVSVGTWKQQRRHIRLRAGRRSLLGPGMPFEQMVLSERAGGGVVIGE